jgi:Ca-activated chloride channel family protein
MTFHNRWISLSVAVIVLGSIAGGCDSAPQPLPESIASARQALTVRAVCLESDASTGGLWTCGEERTVECREHASPGAVETLHVDVPGCPAGDLSVNPGPYGLGTHPIEVFAPATQNGADAGAAICSARLTIVDTTPPRVVSHDQELWPPNHKMHRVTVADCVTVTDACDAATDIRFLWATADEAPDAHGSGHTEPDVQFIDCHTVDVRAERQGGGDGRVYELGYRARDRSGNSVDGTCRVTVPHDQGQGHMATGVATMKVDAPAGCAI